MRDVRDYVVLPWSVRRAEYDDDGQYAALTIDELPGFVVAGRSDAELETSFWPALEAFLQSYLQHGEEPPLPRGIPADFRIEGPALRYPTVVHGQRNKVVFLKEYSSGPGFPPMQQLSGTLVAPA